MYADTSVFSALEVLLWKCAIYSLLTLTWYWLVSVVKWS